MTREQRLTAKVTDAVANRQMNLKRSDLPVKSNVSNLDLINHCQTKYTTLIHIRARGYLPPSLSLINVVTRFKT